MTIEWSEGDPTERVRDTVARVDDRSNRGIPWQHIVLSLTTRAPSTPLIPTPLPIAHWTKGRRMWSDRKGNEG